MARPGGFFSMESIDIPDFELTSSNTNYVDYKRSTFFDI